MPPDSVEMAPTLIGAPGGVLAVGQAAGDLPGELFGIDVRVGIVVVGGSAAREGCGERAGDSETHEAYCLHVKNS